MEVIKEVKFPRAKFYIWFLGSRAVGTTMGIIQVRWVNIAFHCPRSDACRLVAGKQIALPRSGIIDHLIKRGVDRNG